MQSAPPPRRKREIVLRLEAGEAKGWRKLGRGGGGAHEDRIRLSGAEIVFEHAGLLERPLTIPAGLVAVATVDPGRAKVGAESFGRFPILRRMGPKAVIPVEEGVEGWLWTSESGSALPTLGDAAPNLALVFVKPLDDELVLESFRPAALSALAERSPLGAPTVFGLLARVTDATAAQHAFAELGVDHPLTDREVAPAQRRHLPTDRAANPIIHLEDPGARHQGSVPPPGA